jgi:hypothetical protein
MVRSESKLNDLCQHYREDKLKTEMGSVCRE